MMAYATNEWKLTNPKEFALTQKVSKILLLLVVRATETLLETNFYFEIMKNPLLAILKIENLFIH